MFIHVKKSIRDSIPAYYILSLTMSCKNVEDAIQPSVCVSDRSGGYIPITFLYLLLNIKRLNIKLTHKDSFGNDFALCMNVLSFQSDGHMLTTGHKGGDALWGITKSISKTCFLF